MLHRNGGRGWERHGLHRHAFAIAVKWFAQDGGGPAYIEGDMRLLNRIARGFRSYSSALVLPEHHSPLTLEQYLDVLRARNS